VYPKPKCESESWKKFAEVGMDADEHSGNLCRCSAVARSTASCREPAVGRFIDSQEALAIDLVREMCLLERDVSSKFVY
jgi:hypothetical protein